MSKLWDTTTKQKSKRKVVLVQGETQERERVTQRVQPVIKDVFLKTEHRIAGEIVIYRCVYRGRGKDEYECTLNGEEYTGFKNHTAVRSWLALKLFQLEKGQQT